MRIQQLPPFIANQIAAGEVIERPASVVKELLENSLDAGADTIAIEIGYGGLNQIKISDNGAGIVAEDLPLAIAAHATSKINSLDDLYAIDSMGFRGEALASIASVAKVTISSKTSHQETAMMLRVHGEDAKVSPCARTLGTTVDVVDLFFNAPVRKRFLKSEKLEFQAIETVIKRFALSAPGIALTLKHNGKQVLSLPAATSEHTRLTRLTRILGSAFVKDAVYLDVERGAMRLCGWISGANFQRSQNDRQWVYINQRMVKDKLIHHALKQAYDGLLHPGRFPACVLYLTIYHAEVDVNVHPTKHEVRFQQPRLVHDFFTSQLTRALKSVNAVDEDKSYALMAPADREQAQEIYEPYPQLALLSTNVHHAETEVPWVILNSQYLLAFIRQQPYVVDIVALQQHRMEEQLSFLTLPLASRPLLVPIRYLIPKKLKVSKYSLPPSRGLSAESSDLATSINSTDKPHDLGEGELEQFFSQVGIKLEWLGPDEVFIRSIPLCLPYLDLPMFLDALAALEELHSHRLIELMIQSQVFDPRLLSSEEKMELNALLLKTHSQELKKPGLFKVLTVEDCRNLLHV